MNAAMNSLVEKRASRTFITRWLMALFVYAIPGLASAQDESAWTRFRGPNGSGVLEDCRVPLPWKPKDVLWEIRLPGAGNGSPVIWRDRVFLLAALPSDATRFALCYSLSTGELLWKKSFLSRTHALHKFSSYASSTPCVDSRGVYFAWASDESLMVQAFTHDGEERWNRDLGRYVSQHGFGTSPILVDDNLILYDCQDAEDLPSGVPPGKSRLIAFAAASGNIVWEQPCTPVRVCYGAPCVREVDGKKAIIEANTGDGFMAFDAATGKKLWSRKAFDKRVCSSPILAGDWIIATEGSGGGGNQLVMIAGDGSGKEVMRVANQTAAPYVPTPIAVGDTAYLWADNGIVSCIELPSGKVFWKQRIGGNVSSSPILLAGKLIGISDDGVVTILAASRNYERLGRIELNDVIRSTPAADQRHLVIRTDSKLVCIGSKD